MTVAQKLGLAPRPPAGTKPSKTKPSKPGNQRRVNTATTLPFDPQDLSRRLRVVLDEQQKQGEESSEDEENMRQREWEKRKARAEKALQKQREGVAQKPKWDKSSGKPSVQGKRRRSKDKNTTSTPPATKGPQQQAPIDPTERNRSLKLMSRARQKSMPSRTAPAPKVQDPVPPYVGPKQAAKQFTLTTTAINVREGLVHKISLSALDSHLENSIPKGNSSLAQQLSHERNELLEVDETMESEGLYVPMATRRSFATEYGHLLVDRREAMTKRKSTGDLLDRQLSNRPELGDINESGTLDSSLFPPEMQRPDWTQSDERKQPLPTKPRKTPFIKRVDSMFLLRGKLGGATRHMSGDPDMRDREDNVSDDPGRPKSRVSIFFSLLLANE